MNNWDIDYLPEAQKDLGSLDGTQRTLVLKAIQKVSKNPLPQSEGGFGKPLGSRNASNLTGFLKIKLRDAGLRVVYQLVRTDTRMLIIVVGVRSDDEVYKIAEGRAKKHKL